MKAIRVPMPHQLGARCFCYVRSVVEDSCHPGGLWFYCKPPGARQHEAIRIMTPDEATQAIKRKVQPMVYLWNGSFEFPTLQAGAIDGDWQISDGNWIDTR